MSCRKNGNKDKQEKEALISTQTEVIGEELDIQDERLDNATQYKEYLTKLKSNQNLEEQTEESTEKIIEEIIEENSFE